MPEARFVKTAFSCIVCLCLIYIQDVHSQTEKDRISTNSSKDGDLNGTIADLEVARAGKKSNTTSDNTEGVLGNSILHRKLKLNGLEKNKIVFEKRIRKWKMKKYAAPLKRQMKLSKSESQKLSMDDEPMEVRIQSTTTQMVLSTVRPKIAKFNPIINPMRTKFKSKTVPVRTGFIQMKKVNIGGIVNLRQKYSRKR